MNGNSIFWTLNLSLEKYVIVGLVDWSTIIFEEDNQEMQRWKQFITYEMKLVDPLYKLALGDKE